MWLHLSKTDLLTSVLSKPSEGTITILPRAGGPAGAGAAVGPGAASRAATGSGCFRGSTLGYARPLLRLKAPPISTCTNSSRAFRNSLNYVRCKTAALMRIVVLNWHQVPALCRCTTFTV